MTYLKNYPFQCIEQTVSRFLPNAVSYRLLRQAGRDDQQLKASLEQNLAAGLQRLALLQNLDGGWGWWATDKSNPYQNEWDELVKAIRNNKPYNEVKRGINASLVCNMGRMAAHTGQEITFDQVLNSDHEFGVGVDKLTMGSPSPLMPEANGRYPIPMPGQKTREY